MTTDNKLKPLREQIDTIDAQILDLLNQRARVAQQVGHVKAETNAPVFRPEREAQVLRSVAERNPGPLLNTDIQTVFREVMSACRALEKRVTVAYLGPAGTFSEQAVYQQFGRTQWKAYAMHIHRRSVSRNGSWYCRFRRGTD